MRTTTSLPLHILMRKLVGCRGVVNLVTRALSLLHSRMDVAARQGERGLRKHTLVSRKTKILV